MAKYDKKWQNTIKSSKKGGSLAAPGRASDKNIVFS